MVCMEEMNIVIYGKSHDVKKNFAVSLGQYQPKANTWTK